MDRYIIFVDGPNLFGSIRHLGLKVENYEAFFRHVFNKAVACVARTLHEKSSLDSRLARTHWYVVGDMDEWDLDDRKAEEALRMRFRENHEIRRSYLALAAERSQGKSEAQREEEAWRICLHETRDWFQMKWDQLSKMKKFYHAVNNNTDFVDIHECGHWKAHPLERRVEEKGVDTSIAVDMVTQIDTYDVAILISADADAIPSVKFVKNRGKQIGTVEFLKGQPQRERAKQGSSRLKDASDFMITLYEADLVKAGIATHAGDERAC